MADFQEISVSFPKMTWEAKLGYGLKYDEVCV